jgi:hypothetical protein
MRKHIGKLIIAVLLLLPVTTAYGSRVQFRPDADGVKSVKPPKPAKPEKDKNITSTELQSFDNFLDAHPNIGRDLSFLQML